MRRSQGWMCCVLLCFLSKVQAVDYYLAPSGDNTDSGTSLQSPWQTISRLNSVDFKSGDRILFQGGATFTGKLSFDERDGGTLEEPITVTSYGNGRATIHGGDDSSIAIYNSGGYRLANLHLIGSGRTTNNKDGISLFVDLPNGVKVSGVQIENVEVSGFGKAGIQIGAWHKTKSGFSDVLITNSISHDNGDAGISSYGYFDNTATAYSHRNITIRHCKTYNNAGIPDKGNNSGSGIVISDVDGAVIEHCESYNNGWLNNFKGGGPVGIWTWDSNNVTIQSNVSHHNRSGTRDGGGFDIDGGVTNSIMQYNYSHDNDGPGYLVAQFPGARPLRHNIVRQNISQNDARSARGYGAIHFWNGGSGSDISHMLVEDNKIFISPSARGTPHSVRFVGGTSHVTLRNNIFVATGNLPLLSIGEGQDNLLLHGNFYWTGADKFIVHWAGKIYYSLDEWRATTGQEALNGRTLIPMWNQSQSTPAQEP